ncbi:LysR family transcriptional regulator [Leeia sp.]|uniref:LysR family transcriptional regulator n=1 Tax=Leeia sp. TaxID=2884678 RepID=UPI0035ADECBB
MQTLRDLEIFQLAADLGSLSSAARRLDMTPAAVSMAIKRLEAELGVAVFLRSTRSLRLTTEGRVYLDHCRQALQLLADGREAALTGVRALRGLLQLSLPSDLGRNVVLPWLDQFQGQHPELQLRLLVTDRLADIYRQPVDLALRYGTLPDSSLVALPVASDNRRVLCAAPTYIARHGQPATPAALAAHNCLTYQHGDVVYDRWRFFPQSREVSFQVTGNRSTDDGDAVRRWALDGQGIAYKSALDVAEDLLAGRLVALCPDWAGEPVPLNLLCAGRRQVSPLVQTLRQFLTERCADVLSRLSTAGLLPARRG